MGRCHSSEFVIVAVLVLFSNEKPEEELKKKSIGQLAHWQGVPYNVIQIYLFTLVMRWDGIVGYSTSHEAYCLWVGTIFRS